MRIYLIRHGQTDMNAIHRIDSYRPGASLTELGRRQAAELVERFDGIDIEGIHVSTLVRTRETASPLARARGLEPVEHAGLREIEAGSLEGGTDEASYREYFSTVERWPRRPPRGSGRGRRRRGRGEDPRGGLPPGPRAHEAPPGPGTAPRRGSWRRGRGRGRRGGIGGRRREGHLVS